MGVCISSDKNQSCYICNKNKITDDNYYFFKITGLGKHNGKTICQNCLIIKFKNKNLPDN